MGNLSLLTYLDVGSNRLSGSIPTGFVLYFYVVKLHCFCCNSATLYFGRSKCFAVFGGGFTGLSNLTALRVLDLSSNRLTGSLDWKILMELPQLDRFNVSYNYISGIETTPPLDCSFAAVQTSFNAVPGSFISKSRLASVNLNNNHLRFDITEFFNCIQIVIPYISYLDISSNDLHGEVVDQIFTSGNYQYSSSSGTQENTLKTMNFCNASSNHISGSVSAQWANFPLPLSLDLSSNQFSGTIPVTLFDSSIVQLRLEKNHQLIGAIDIKFGESDYIDDVAKNRLFASNIV